MRLGDYSTRVFRPAGRSSARSVRKRKVLGTFSAGFGRGHGSRRRDSGGRDRQSTRASGGQDLRAARRGRKRRRRRRRISLYRFFQAAPHAQDPRARFVGTPERRPCHSLLFAPPSPVPPPPARSPPRRTGNARRAPPARPFAAPSARAFSFSRPGPPGDDGRPSPTRGDDDAAARAFGACVC